MTTTGSRWNQVAGRAAIVNGAVFVVVPFVLFTYANYTSDLVRPREPIVSAGQASGEVLSRAQGLRAASRCSYSA